MPNEDLYEILANPNPPNYYELLGNDLAGLQSLLDNPKTTRREAQLIAQAGVQAAFNSRICDWTINNQFINTRDETQNPPLQAALLSMLRIAYETYKNPDTKQAYDDALKDATPLSPLKHPDEYVKVFNACRMLPLSSILPAYLPKRETLQKFVNSRPPSQNRSEFALEALRCGTYSNISILGLNFNILLGNDPAQKKVAILKALAESNGLSCVVRHSRTMKQEVLSFGGGLNDAPAIVLQSVGTFTPDEAAKTVALKLDDTIANDPKLLNSFENFLSYIKLKTQHDTQDNSSFLFEGEDAQIVKTLLAKAKKIAPVIPADTMVSRTSRPPSGGHAR